MARLGQNKPPASPPANEPRHSASRQLPQTHRCPRSIATWQHQPHTQPGYTPQHRHSPLVHFAALPLTHQRLRERKLKFRIMPLFYRWTAC
ncbi:hypothetical protein SISNIDRAFT_224648 [Sistotremastrum niveocremeum HHB9708]|uniref:Uncharacterized protein n=1 Tax=Sistotremastrum niveocremeum HHB9708 TaxID=1314777 RepID=A0A164QHY4_9AGAM|nr:hypothetical protein SISNIDRAFT_224648 [Sistotremastrum niveocremeum HHB9708]